MDKKSIPKVFEIETTLQQQKQQELPQMTYQKRFPAIPRCSWKNTHISLFNHLNWLKMIKIQVDKVFLFSFTNSGNEPSLKPHVSDTQRPIPIKAIVAITMPGPLQRLRYSGRPRCLCCNSNLFQFKPPGFRNSFGIKNSQTNYVTTLISTFQIQ